jgi:hypothetical protein
MYDLVQTALTATIEAIALVAFIGLPAHYIITSHVREVQSWGTPHATPEPHVEVEPEVKTEVVIKSPEAETVTEVAPSVKVVEQVVKAPQSKLQPMSVGAAAVDYTSMTSEQLRKQCALQGIEWRNGGDYGKPMKKIQMIAVLR